MTFTFVTKTPAELAAEHRADLARLVTVERDRRLHAGVFVSVSGYGDIPVQGRPNDQINLIALGDTARELAAGGVTDPVIRFRDRDNVNHDLTPAQVVEMVAAAKIAASQIYAAAWALKDGEVIPENFADDRHWP